MREENEFTNKVYLTPIKINILNSMKTQKRSQNPKTQNSTIRNLSSLTPTLNHLEQAADAQKR